MLGSAFAITCSESPEPASGLGTPHTLAELDDVRAHWFDMHVPWHRIDRVVDISADGGELLAEQLRYAAKVSGTLIATGGTAAIARQRLAEFGPRVQVQAGTVLDRYPAGADYYLLPHTVGSLARGPLFRIFRSLVRALPTRGRALLCIPAAVAEHVLAVSAAAGLEVTRQGEDGELRIVELGLGLWRPLSVPAAADPASTS